MPAPAAFCKKSERIWRCKLVEARLPRCIVKPIAEWWLVVRMRNHDLKWPHMPRLPTRGCSDPRILLHGIMWSRIKCTRIMYGVWPFVNGRVWRSLRPLTRNNREGYRSVGQSSHCCCRYFTKPPHSRRDECIVVVKLLHQIVQPSRRKLDFILYFTEFDLYNTLPSLLCLVIMIHEKTKYCTILTDSNTYLKHNLNWCRNGHSF